MEPQIDIQKLEEKLKELQFYKTMIDSLPCVVYLNEIDRSGDLSTTRNVWTNQFGLEYIGFSQEEIITLGHEYTKRIMHPDDMDIMPVALKLMEEGRKNQIFIGLYRVKTRYEDFYRWSYSLGVELETPEEYPYRQFLSALFIISEDMHCVNQLTALLKEVGRLKNQIKIAELSKREVEVLSHIAKGKSDQEIANLMFISVGTAKKHHNNILHKLSMHKTSELVALASQCGL